VAVSRGCRDRKSVRLGGKFDTQIGWTAMRELVKRHHTTFCHSSAPIPLSHDLEIRHFDGTLDHETSSASPNNGMLGRPTNPGARKIIAITLKSSEKRRALEIKAASVLGLPTANV
jgi:hypothetical protein